MKKPENILVTIAVLAAVVTGVYYFDLVLCWLTSELGSSFFETLRNIALFFAALIGLPLAFWRIRVANRQAETSERGLRNDQFQRGEEMLGSKERATRLSGVYMLERLAQDYPKDCLDQVIAYLANFVRRPAHDEETAKPKGASKTEKLPHREDVWEAVRTICKLNSHRTVEHDQPNIARSDLSGMRFSQKNFSRMILHDADMQKTTLNHCNFTEAELNGANLTGARLVNSHCRGTEFFQANFTDTDISSTDLSGARMLIQKQLDQACHSPTRRPKLPPGVSMDHKAAVARWEKLHGGEN